MKNFALFIWSLLLFTQIILAAGLIGVIYPPDAQKTYHLNQKDIEAVSDRLNDILQRNIRFMSNCERRHKIIESSSGAVYYKDWPIDSLIFIDMQLDSKKMNVMLEYYRIGLIDYNHIEQNIGRINRSDYEGSSLIKQIMIINLFEKNVLNGMSYRSDTNFLRDCYNYLFRQFIDISVYLSVPFYLLTLCLPLIIYDKKQKKEREFTNKNHE